MTENENQIHWLLRSYNVYNADTCRKESESKQESASKQYVVITGERREGERTTWQKGSVRFGLIPIDSTYRGNMVRTEVMSIAALYLLI